MQTIPLMLLKLYDLMLQKIEFWETLCDHIQNTRSEKHLFIEGELNGHVGKARNGFAKWQ